MKSGGNVIILFLMVVVAVLGAGIAVQNHYATQRDGNAIRAQAEVIRAQAEVTRVQNEIPRALIKLLWWVGAGVFLLITGIILVMSFFLNRALSTADNAARMVAGTYHQRPGIEVNPADTLYLDHTAYDHRYLT
jgi:hypothetical protein